MNKYSTRVNSEHLKIKQRESFLEQDLVLTENRNVEEEVCVCDKVLGGNLC